MALKSILVVAIVLVLSSNANAAIINTLNGNNYQWLELTETAGMSRNQVEAELTNINSPLYGYQYAPRALVEDLLLSYATFDGANGWHGESTVVSGVVEFFNDFGSLNSSQNALDVTFTTVDGYQVQYYGFEESSFYYGLTNECGGGASYTCIANQVYAYNSIGTNTMASQNGTDGWNASQTWRISSDIDINDPNIGSLLVTLSPVPLPASFWLFVSGLVGLISIVRSSKLA